jgi:cyclic pyranopterin phosphate synthase
MTAKPLVDSFGRTINYLRISVTDRCNLRCVYCLPHGEIAWQPPEALLTSEEIIRVAAGFAKLGVSQVRLTGGEPLVRPDLLEIVQGLAKTPGIGEVSLTTNGIMLADLAEPLVRAGLSRVNISLDTLQVEKYRWLTRGGSISRVWRGIEAAERSGLVPVKINVVVVRGLNAVELPELARLTLEHDWHVRFIEMMPVANEEEWGEGFPAAGERYYPVSQMQADLVDLGLEPAEGPVGNGPARTFRLRGARGTLGFISPIGDHFCARCNRMRLTADGSLRPCLLQDSELNVREALRRGENIEELLREAVQRKPAGHALAVGELPATRRMAQIGG